MTIILYDIPSKIGAWSPNTWKTRMSLNYKGLDYRTEWIEFPDIEPTLKKLGVSPTSKKADGSDYYTVPVIYDPKTKNYIAESFIIAQYLDDTYPEKPRLFPPGYQAAVELFQHQFVQSYASRITPLIVMPIRPILSPRSQEYTRAYEKFFQMKIEEMAPAGPVREEKFAQLKEGLTQLATFYEKNGKDKLFFFGDIFSFADVIMVSNLLCPKTVLEVEEWEFIANLDGGRWGKLVEATKAYQRKDL